MTDKEVKLFVKLIDKIRPYLFSLLWFPLTFYVSTRYFSLNNSYSLGLAWVVFSIMIASYGTEDMIIWRLKND